MEKTEKTRKEGMPRTDLSSMTTGSFHLSEVAPRDVVLCDVAPCDVA